ITRTHDQEFGLGYEELFECLHKLIGTNRTKVTTEMKILDCDVKEFKIDVKNDMDTFGVDPITKDLNVVDMYKHLLEKYQGDRAQIREFLRTLNSDFSGPVGFMHNSVLEKNFNGMNDVEQDE